MAQTVLALPPAAFGSESAVVSSRLLRNTSEEESALLSRCDATTASTPFLSVIDGGAVAASIDLDVVRRARSAAAACVAKAGQATRHLPALSLCAWPG